MHAYEPSLRVALIRPDDVRAAWPTLWPFLERAARRTRDLAEARVHGVIERGDAQLWTVLDPSGPVAGIATQITLEPEKRCRLWLVGGSRLDEWAPCFLAAVEPWARSLGCAALWGTQSRPGWARIVRLFGGQTIAMADGNPAWGRRI